MALKPSSTPTAGVAIFGFVRFKTLCCNEQLKIALSPTVSILKIIEIDYNDYMNFGLININQTKIISYREQKQFYGLRVRLNNL